MAQVEWHDCNEEDPPEGEIYWVWDVEHKFSWLAEAYYIRGKMVWRDTFNEDIAGTITHWARLEEPEPPQEEDA